MYTGLFFVSLYIFPIYSPKIPIDSNCTPPIKYNDTNNYVQPVITLSIKNT